jgi:ABC-type glycerol-3-phosphate transport system substrate-binding protein
VEGRTSDKRITIQYWEKWTGFEDDAMQAVVDDFNRSQDRIFVKKLTVSQIDRKLMLAAAGGDPPDVAGLWSHTLPDFSEKGALTPLDKLAQQSGVKREDYIPVIWDLCRHRGFLWGLPTTPASVALHWNKQMFREAGLDPDRPPRSLDELDAMNDRLTVVDIERAGKTERVRFLSLTDAERQAKKFRLVQVGHLPQEPGWWMQMWGYWFGGDLWDGDRQITANSPENIAAFAWLRQHAEKFGVDNLRSFGASFGNFASPQSPYLSGKVAMVLQGVWMYNFIDKFAPHLEWAAAPFPAKDPERFPQVTIVESDVLVIPKGARHPREAFEFIRYVNTQKPMEKLCLGHRKFTALAEVSPEFIKSHPNPFITTFIELAKSPHARYVPRLSIWQEYKDEVAVAVDRVQALMSSPAAALDQVQQRMQWKFDRVLRRWDTVGNERVKEWSDYDAR